jgi:DNA-binding NtrC family response regulator
VVEKYGKEITGFDDSAMTALKRHLWPGNVRELSHVVERAVLMAEGEKIRADDLGLSPHGRGAAPTLDDMSLEEVERTLIEKAMRRFDGNVSQAANALGLSRSALYRRLEKHQL